MASFNGRFFDGGYSGKTATRDYIDEQIRNTLKQVDLLDGAIFTDKDYCDLEIQNESIIYCDIPYKNTKQYSTSKNFDYDIFYQWCKEMTTKGHTVYVSEYDMPSDFKCVWSKEIKSYMKPSRAIDCKERLFLYCN